VWKTFQGFFFKNVELAKYAPFFKQLFKDCLECFVKQNVFVVEARHIAGMVFGDDKQKISYLDELKIIKEIVDDIQKTAPLFKLRLIITGLKVLGASHIDLQFEHIQSVLDCGDPKLVELITGFDLVNEEDFCPELKTFAKQLIANRNMTMISTDGKQVPMPMFLHAGETQNRYLHNVQDAIALGSKRIGHAFQLQLFPEVQKVVKEKDICLEVCPMSNFLLGYSFDLRTHPVSYMLTRGIQATISSDDAGFFGYEGVTMDYLYAAGAWTLDIKDLKQLSLNGITYSTLTEAEKKELIEKEFNPKWDAWVKMINESY